MTAKRMRKLLMAAGAPRNVANKAAKACGGGIPHEKLFFAICFMPGLVKIFEDGVRYGADIKASFGDAPEDVGYQLIKE